MKKVHEWTFQKTRTGADLVKSEHSELGGLVVGSKKRAGSHVPYDSPLPPGIIPEYRACMTLDHH